MAHSLPFVQWDEGRGVFRVNEDAAAYLGGLEENLGEGERAGGGAADWSGQWVGARNCSGPKRSLRPPARSPLATAALLQPL